MSGIGASLNLALSAFDVWGAYGTLTDPCASRIDKASSVGLAIFGIFGGAMISGGIKAANYASVSNKLLKIYGKSNGVISELGAFSRASEFGVQSFRDLGRLTRGTGLQRHHLIEKRFAGILGIDPNDMASIALTPAEHQVFTNAWRKAIPYGDGTRNADYGTVMSTAKEIYSEYPEILRVLGLQ